MTEKERRQRIRRKKRKIQRMIWMELTVIIGLVSFIAGRKIGEASASSKMTYTGENKVYASGKDADDDIDTGEMQKNDKNESRDPLPDSLILVNKDNKLPDDYEVKLKKLPDGTNRGAEVAYQPLVDMLNAGRKTGLKFEVCSSYRSVERQKELLDEDVEALMKKGYTYQEAYDEVTRETMPPGYSEHSTGLAFDIVALDYQMLDAKQASTEESKWLRKHCAEYGFILRYPADKEDVTKISYESWHFRYVGVEAASYIMENGITLEEYLEEKNV